MSAATVTVDQGRPHDVEELPAVLAQSILSAPRVAAKLSEAWWLLVWCPVGNRIGRDIRTVDHGLKEAPSRRVAMRVIWLTGVGGRRLGRVSRIHVRRDAKGQEPFRSPVWSIG